MISIRKAEDRGLTRNQWLNSFHSFSFGEYYDASFMGFENLRVINEDIIQPATGFGVHPHRDMEIITYVVEGALQHKDSLGTGSIIKPGEIQRMSAGTGIRHSEVNHSSTDYLHLLQIWILPEQQNLPPSYEQKTISKINNKLILIGSKNSSNSSPFSVRIHQDVELYVGYLTTNAIIEYVFSPSRTGWLQLVKGKVHINSSELVAGDGCAITEENQIKIECVEDAELLLFDLG